MTIFTAEITYNIWYVLTVIGAILYAICTFIILCEYAWYYGKKAVALIRIQLCPKHRGRWLPKTAPTNHHNPLGGNDDDCGCGHDHDKHDCDEHCHDEDKKARAIKALIKKAKKEFKDD